MSRRRAYRTPTVSPSANDLAAMQYGEQRTREPADLTAVPDASAEDEWADAIGDAVLLGVVVVLAAASWPFVLVALRWWAGI